MTMLNLRGPVLPLLAYWSIAPLASATPVPPPPTWTSGCVVFGTGRARATIERLTYSDTERPYPGANAGTQIAQLGLALDLTGMPTGYHIVAYRWQPLWKTATGVVSGSLVVMGNGDAATATGCAYTAGIFGVSCLVTLAEGANPAHQNDYTLTGDCAVVGGPLSFSLPAAGGSSRDPTPPNAEWTCIVPDHDDNDLSKPFHLQYFGYSSTLGCPPPNTQPARCQAAVSVPVQPYGTTLVWHVDDQALAIAGGGNVAPAPLTLVAVNQTGSGSASPIWCEYTYTYHGTHGDAGPTTVRDDTILTGYPLDPTHVLRWMNIMDVHRPTDTSERTHRPDDTVASGVYGPLLPAGGTYAGDGYSINLLSHWGVRMPDVWVQERFIAPLPPPGFDMNSDGNSWTTHGIENGGPWYGSFQWDWIRWAWSPPTPFANQTFWHEYYAATRSTVTGGVIVGRWRMTMYGGSPNDFGSTVHVRE